MALREDFYMRCNSCLFNFFAWNIFHISFSVWSVTVVVEQVWHKSIRQDAGAYSTLHVFSVTYSEEKTNDINKSQAAPAPLKKFNDGHRHIDSSCMAVIKIDHADSFLCDQMQASPKSRIQDWTVNKLLSFLLIIIFTSYQQIKKSNQYVDCHHLPSWYESSVFMESLWGYSDVGDGTLWVHYRVCSN